MDIYEVVIKLIGSVRPVGETHIDNERFENLQRLTELTNKLLSDIDGVAYDNKGKHEYSIKRAVKHCTDFCDKIGIVE